MKRLAKVVAVLAVMIFVAGCTSEKQGEEVARIRVQMSYPYIREIQYLKTLNHGIHLYAVCVGEGYVVIAGVNDFGGSTEMVMVNPEMIRCVPDNK